MKKSPFPAASPVLAAFMAAFMPSQETAWMRRSVRRFTGKKLRDEFRNEHPEIVEVRINLAEAKRERKATKAAMDDAMPHANYYRGWWQPHPHSSKPESRQHSRRSGGQRYLARGGA